MTDPRNFLFNSNYPIDQIIYLNSGSMTLTGGGTTINFAHNLSFIPLIIGTWSTSPTFETSKEGGFFGFEGTDPNTIYVTFSANTSNITVSAFGPNVTVAIYYRIYGFMPSNVNVDIPYTALASNTFQFNTNYNYTKLMPTLTGIASAGTTTITHNLGYRPQVIAWTDIVNSGGVRYITAVVGSGTVKVTNTTVVITEPSGSVHYRIYADGQI